MRAGWLRERAFARAVVRTNDDRDAMDRLPENAGAVGPALFADLMQSINNGETERAEHILVWAMHAFEARQDLYNMLALRNMSAARVASGTLLWPKEAMRSFDVFMQSVHMVARLAQEYNPIAVASVGRVNEHKLYVTDANNFHYYNAVSGAMADTKYQYLQSEFPYYSKQALASTFGDEKEVYEMHLAQATDLGMQATMLLQPLSTAAANNDNLLPPQTLLDTMDPHVCFMSKLYYPTLQMLSYEEQFLNHLKTTEDEHMFDIPELSDPATYEQFVRYAPEKKELATFALTAAAKETNIFFAMLYRSDRFWQYLRTRPELYSAWMARALHSESLSTGVQLLAARPRAVSTLFTENSPTDSMLDATVGNAKAYSKAAHAARAAYTDYQRAGAGLAKAMAGTPDADHTFIAFSSHPSISIASIGGQRPVPGYINVEEQAEVYVPQNLYYRFIKDIAHGISTTAWPKQLLEDAETDYIQFADKFAGLVVEARDAFLAELAVHNHVHFHIKQKCLAFCARHGLANIPLEWNDVLATATGVAEPPDYVKQYVLATLQNFYVKPAVLRYFAMQYMDSRLFHACTTNGGVPLTTLAKTLPEKIPFLPEEETVDAIVEILRERVVASLSRIVSGYAPPVPATMVNAAPSKPTPVLSTRPRPVLRARAERVNARDTPFDVIRQFFGRMFNLQAYDYIDVFKIKGQATFPQHQGMEYELIPFNTLLQFARDKIIDLRVSMSQEFSDWNESALASSNMQNGVNQRKIVQEISTRIEQKAKELSSSNDRERATSEAKLLARTNTLKKLGELLFAEDSFIFSSAVWSDVGEDEARLFAPCVINTIVDVLTSRDVATYLSPASAAESKTVVNSNSYLGFLLYKLLVIAKLSAYAGIMYSRNSEYSVLTNLARTAGDPANARQKESMILTLTKRWPTSRNNMLSKWSTLVSDPAYYNAAFWMTRCLHNCLLSIRVDGEVNWRSYVALCSTNILPNMDFNDPAIRDLQETQARLFGTSIATLPSISNGIRNGLRFFRNVAVVAPNATESVSNSTNSTVASSTTDSVGSETNSAVNETESTAIDDNASKFVNVTASLKINNAASIFSSTFNFIKGWFVGETLLSAKSVASALDNANVTYVSVPNNDGTTTFQDTGGRVSFLAGPLSNKSTAGAGSSTTPSPKDDRSYSQQIVASNYFGISVYLLSCMGRLAYSANQAITAAKKSQSASSVSSKWTAKFFLPDRFYSMNKFSVVGILDAETSKDKLFVARVYNLATYAILLPFANVANRIVFAKLASSLLATNDIAAETVNVYMMYATIDSMFAAVSSVFDIRSSSSATTVSVAITVLFLLTTLFL